MGLKGISDSYSAAPDLVSLPIPCPSYMLRLSAVAGAFVVFAAGDDHRTVVVTGATGQTGSYTYLLLKEAGISVRGLVRNVSKAREYLGCKRCDASEGIFVGDVTQQDSLVPAMAGAAALVITTGGAPAKEVLFDGVANQVAAFLGSPGPKPQDRHVSLISMQYTTLPDTLVNKVIARLWGGWDVGFYSLQGEARLMSANVPFTIIKACGLSDEPAKRAEILVGHDDKGWSLMDAHTVSRHDLARVLAAAATNPDMAKGIRMDFCSKPGTPKASQADAINILKQGMQPWDPRKTRFATAVV